MSDMQPSQARALALAALCGSKIALGPAFLAASSGWPSRRTWASAAAGEMLLDKLGVFPARYRPMLLIPHAVAGAWTARESLKEDGVDDPGTVAVAAAVAAGVAISAPLLRLVARKVLRVPDALLGVAEDYAALHFGAKAMGMSMDDVTQAGKDALEDLKGQVKPTLKKVGVDLG